MISTKLSPINLIVDLSGKVIINTIILEKSKTDSSWRTVFGDFRVDNLAG